MLLTKFSRKIIVASMFDWFLIRQTNYVIAVNFDELPNGLASQRKFWTYVQLAFRLATHLRRLASTCVDFSRASRRKGFFRLATKRKSTQVDRK